MGWEVDLWVDPPLFLFLAKNKRVLFATQSVLSLVIGFTIPSEKGLSLGSKIGKFPKIVLTTFMASLRAKSEKFHF